MNLIEHLNSAPLIEVSGQYLGRKTLPRVRCADGTTLSVQAGKGLYCIPRNDDGPWTHVEVGYPSVDPGPLMLEYAETPDDPTGTVYAYVPIHIVMFFIGAHGGLVDG